VNELTKPEVVLFFVVACSNLSLIEIGYVRGKDCTYPGEGMNQDGELSLKHSGYCTTRPSIEHFVGSCTVRQAAKAVSVR
jgi:hypothetical protein